jgi:hypothetical protein
MKCLNISVLLFFVYSFSVVYAQTVGIGITSFVPKNTLDVDGGVALGTYAGVNVAPVNGLIIPGNVGVGITTATYALTIQSPGAGGGNFISLYNGSGTRLTSIAVAFFTNTSGQFFLANSGPVDNAGNNFTVFRYNADANRIFFGTDGATNGYITSTHDIIFTVGHSAQTVSATPVMILKAASKFVGIGTTSPLSKLDIYTANGYQQLRLRASITPTSSADAGGTTGNVAWDTSYFYIKTSVGWKRMAVATF